MEFNPIIPELSVSDINVSKRFYIGVLGFKLEYERTGEDFAFISFEKTQMMIEKMNNHWKTDTLEYPFGRGVNFQISAADVDALREKLIFNGVKLFREIHEVIYKENDTFHRIKEFLVQDPDGYLLRFSQSL
jgi:catechol 2,3-dioxygenase-like lactoylglutathione lyase family enzyme